MAANTLEIFFVDGNPEGVLTAEVFGWTGHVLRIPRVRLSDGLRRVEASYTGVYLLFGEEEGELKTYVGEGENVARRIKDHDAKKDWWSEAFLITSSNDGLHKAHVKYLESRIVEVIAAAGQAVLENGNIPPRSSMNEAAIANMEDFLETATMVVAALGQKIFRNPKRSSDSARKANDRPGTRFVLTSERTGVSGVAELQGSDFIVLEGSIGRSHWASQAAVTHSYAALFNKLVNEGILERTGDQTVFRRDYAFKSPSAAGAVLFGRNCNGRTSWHVETDGRSYAQWEEDELSEALSGEDND
ncbi:GIY-YIG nuclease family protein [Alphaproteobacteria bacterium KMM 3653]|uniref:GIY-YIG nuclease family protein n=1 Tax=Harenicola maris TaxID=2841044 RepID=A0AAP2CRK0_9RHOB|nr:GIY-YIG nuclease family protein [Harenicola maris]